MLPEGNFRNLGIYQAKVWPHWLCTQLPWWPLQPEFLVLLRRDGFHLTETHEYKEHGISQPCSQVQCEIRQINMVGTSAWVQAILNPCSSFLTLTSAQGLGGLRTQQGKVPTSNNTEFQGDGKWHPSRKSPESDITNPHYCPLTQRERMQQIHLPGIMWAMEKIRQGTEKTPPQSIAIYPGVSGLRMLSFLKRPLKLTSEMASTRAG